MTRTAARSRVRGAPPVREATRDEGDVLAPCRQIRRLDAQPEAKIELGAKGLLSVRRCDDANVGFPSARVAEPLVLARVEQPQQVGLRSLRQLADLVEEKRRAVGLTDETRALQHPRVRIAFHVSEELRIDEGIGERGSVATDEGTAAALRTIVNGARDQLLTGAARADDQHVSRQRRDEPDLVADLPRRGRFADETIVVGLAEQMRRHVRPARRHPGGPLHATNKSCAPTCNVFPTRSAPDATSLPSIRITACPKLVTSITCSLRTEAVIVRGTVAATRGDQSFRRSPAGRGRAEAAGARSRARLAPRPKIRDVPGAPGGGRNSSPIRCGASRHQTRTSASMRGAPAAPFPGPFKLSGCVSLSLTRNARPPCAYTTDQNCRDRVAPVLAIAVRENVSPGCLLMGKWRIVRELAHGGTSTVYEAIHRNGRRAAVKVLRPALAADHGGERGSCARARSRTGSTTPASSR